MKKVNETPERLLIYVDNDLAKSQSETLKKIFAEVEAMKTIFLELEVPWNKAEFVKTLTEGPGWITEFLNQKLTEIYKSMGKKVTESITKVDKEKLQEDVLPIEPIAMKIKALLKEMDIEEEQVPFDAENNPSISNDLKVYLQEKCKHYATGNDEIAVYEAVKKFADAVNAFERFIVATPYPTILDIPAPTERIQDFKDANFFMQFSYFDLDFNTVDDGYCTLLVNHKMFDEFEAVKRKNAFDTAMQSLPREVHYREDSIINEIPVAPFKLPRDTGAKVDGNIPATKKSRWGDDLLKR
jgi:hypothetical protein